MNDFVILVDEHDNETGIMDKLTAHQAGVLHRAFSVFIFNSKRELLLQQRADEKYHSAGLWSNTCCSHPGKGEGNDEAVRRRLNEEMGMNCKTAYKFHFIYKTVFENGLTEYELDHVYFGQSDQLPVPNKDEVKNWRYVDLKTLEEEITLHPENFSSWLKICFPKVKEHADTYWQ